MSQSDCTGSLIKLWPVLLDHFKDAPEMPGYAAMLKGYVKVDPFECILCGHRLTFLRFRAGEPLSELVHHALVQAQIRSI